MSQLAAFLLGAAALLTHLAICGTVAPLLAWAPNAASPERGLASPAQWRARWSGSFAVLGSLAGRQPVRSDGASMLSVAAPIVGLALSTTAAVLVPSFATGMLVSPLSDLCTVLVLLAGARLVDLLAAADEGLAAPGLAAVGGAVDALLAAPGAVLAASVIALAAGGTALDQILTGARALASPGLLCCVAALCLAALAGGGRGEALSQTLSGPDLALVRLGDGVRRLAWIDLLGALAWPGSLAPAQSGPLPWLLALGCWAARLLVGALLLRLLAGRLGSDATRRGLAGLALLASLLAPILLLAGRAGE